MTFSSDLRRFAEKTGARHDLVKRKVALEVFRGVVFKSPVGNPDLWESPAPPGYAGGRFRANWQISTGAPDLSTTQNTDAQGGQTVLAAAAALERSIGNAPIWITNNLPYGPALERGWSQQAPAGMVATTVNSFRTYLNGAVAEAKRERP